MLPVHTFGARTTAIHLGGVQIRVMANVFPQLRVLTHVCLSLLGVFNVVPSH